jgi:uncharacterized delta-60 repeat protein
LRDAARPVVEAIERRVLLSAGDPDVTFGAGGLAAIDLGFGTDPEANTFQLADMDNRGGKTVAVGDVFGTKHQLGMLAVRLNATGSIDQTFGGTGQIGLGEYSPDHVLLQADGKILIAARQKDGPEVDASFTTPVLLRLNADGSLDTTFSGDGKIELPLQTGAMTVAADGSIYLGGSYIQGGWIIVAKYLPDGSPDNGFGGVGVIGLETYTGTVRGMTQQSDGGVVISADTIFVPMTPGEPEQPSGPALVKFGGDLGGASTRMTFLPAGYSAADVTTVGSDKIIVGASPKLLQYNADLSYNMTFSPFNWGGRHVTDIRTSYDGKAVAFAAGATNGDPDGDAIAVRFNRNGTVDRSFAPGLGYRPVAGPNGDLRDGDSQVISVSTDSANVLAEQYWYNNGPDISGIAPSADGILTLNGGAGNDTVRIFATQLVPGGSTVWRVRKNGFYRALAPSSVTKLIVNVFGGNNVVDLSPAAVSSKIFAGDGNDDLTGGNGVDQIDAGPGNDVLHGRGGNDILRGAAGFDFLFGDSGNDTLDGGANGDQMSGGTGTDTVDYSTRTAAVQVHFDGTGASGEAGEGDVILTDVENANGGSGNDVMVGSSAANVLKGNAGNDRIFGGGGNDTLYGGVGDDRLDGGTGADDMWGGAGTDTIDYGTRTKGVYVGLGSYADDGEAGEHDNARSDNEIVIGGAGNDTLIGTAVKNILFGGAGDDTLYGRGGVDILTGGPGHDKLFGEDGNDQLYAKDGNISDMLDGGPGFDTASRDLVDSVKNVEKTT